MLIVAILGALGIWKMSNKWWASLFLGLFFIVANYWVWHDAYLSMKGRELDLHSREADIRVLRTEILAKDQQLAQHPAPRAAQFPQRNKLLSLARDLTRFAAPHSREANILGEVRKQFGGRVTEAISYLKAQGFIDDDLNNWEAHVGMAEIRGLNMITDKMRRFADLVNE